jgi:hypothetical protein
MRPSPFLLRFLHFLVRGQRIDRRVLYLLLAFVVGLPFVVPISTPQAVVMPDTKRFYETIEAVANDPTQSQKLVIITTNYAAGTVAENGAQAEAVMRHLMRRKLKFATFAYSDPQGRQQGLALSTRLAKQYGYVYGRDFVNFGYRPPDAIVPLLKAAVRDIPGTFANDIQGTPLSQVPVMQNVRTVNDIGLIVEVSSFPNIINWIEYFQRTGEQPIPTLYCPTSIMAPEAFPYLKSGQLQGLLVGLSGAIEYEGLLGEQGFGTQASASLSLAHFLIIGLIVVGNAGMFAERYLNRSLKERADV